MLGVGLEKSMTREQDYDFNARYRFRRRHWATVTASWLIVSFSITCDRCFYQELRPSHSVRDNLHDDCREGGFYAEWCTFAILPKIICEKDYTNKYDSTLCKIHITCTWGVCSQNVLVFQPLKLIYPFSTILRQVSWEYVWMYREEHAAYAVASPWYVSSEALEVIYKSVRDSAHEHRNYYVRREACALRECSHAVDRLSNISRHIPLSRRCLQLRVSTVGMQSSPMLASECSRSALKQADSQLQTRLSIAASSIVSLCKSRESQRGSSGVPRHSDPVSLAFYVLSDFVSFETPLPPPWSWS